MISMFDQKIKVKIGNYMQSIYLGHFGMNVVATVAQFSDFLGQQLHTLSRIAKDDTLVYL